MSDKSDEMTKCDECQKKKKFPRKFACFTGQKCEIC